MKTEKKLNLLLVKDEKLDADVLRKLVETNTNVDEVEVLLFREIENVRDEIKSSDAKSQLVVLSEPAHGKIKFADEVPARTNQIKKFSTESEVIAPSTPNKVETIIETFRSGAYDGVLKDENGTRNLLNSIHRFLNNREIKSGTVKQSEWASAN